MESGRRSYFFSSSSSSSSSSKRSRNNFNSRFDRAAAAVEGTKRRSGQLMGRLIRSVEEDESESDHSDEAHSNSELRANFEETMLQQGVTANQAEENESREGEAIPKSRAERSLLCELFEPLKSSSGREQVRCDLPSSISKQGRAHDSCNTFTFKNGWRHLEKWHPSLFKAVRDPDRTLPVSSLAQIYRTDSSQLNTIPKMFGQKEKTLIIGKVRWALFFILNHIPCACAGKRFSQTLRSSGADSEMIVTPTTLSRLFLPAILAAVEERLREFLNHVNSISLTYDGWTDRVKNKFFVITAHCMDAQWQVRRILLDVVNLEESATIEALESQVRSAMNRKLPENLPLAAVITDGASNMIGSAECISGDTLWCVCHRLHLVVTDSLMQDTRALQVIQNVRNYCKAVRASTELSRDFKNAQQSARPLSLSLDMPTRWNSIFAMISKFIRLYQVILAVSVQDSFREISTDLPLYSDLIQLQDILKPLAMVNIALQGEGNLALAYYRLSFIAQKQTTGGVFSNLQQILKRQFDERFSGDLSTASLITRSSLLWPQSVGPSFSRQLQIECWKALIQDITFLIPTEDEESSAEEDPESLIQYVASEGARRTSIAAERRLAMVRALDELRKNWNQFEEQE